MTPKITRRRLIVFRRRPPASRRRHGYPMTPAFVRSATSNDKNTYRRVAKPFDVWRIDTAAITTFDGNRENLLTRF